MDENRIRRAFCKHPDGSWECREPAELHTPVGRIQVTVGSTFYPGTTFMGFDLANWLEKRLGNAVARCDDFIVQEGTGE
jgi:hypothetical protein